MFGLHATWLVNSATHMWGSRRFATHDDSRNNWWVALITFGEGWHNNHHAHPTSARHGLAWYELIPPGCASGSSASSASPPQSRPRKSARDVPDKRPLRRRLRPAPPVGVSLSYGGFRPAESVAFFLALGAGVVLVTLLLYVGWVVLDWRTGLLLFFGAVLLTLIVSGVVLNTIFLVREIRQHDQQDAFINAVTHELKTPVASVRLYLETLQARPIDEAKRNEFYRVMLDDCDRLLATIEQILRTGRAGASSRRLNLTTVDLGGAVEGCLARARMLYPLPAASLEYTPVRRSRSWAIPTRCGSDLNLIENAVKYSGDNVKVSVRPPLLTSAMRPFG